MFERYSEQARRVIFFARYEASVLGAEYIEPEHLLLGAFREGAPVRKLISIDAREQMRQEIQRATEIREKVTTSIDIPLSMSSKRVLAYACEEAERLAESKIEAEHLIMGLLRESDTLAARLLMRQGVRLDELRAQATAPPAPRRPDNQSIVRALRESFDPVTRRLTPEIEPATVFLLK